MSDRHEQWVRVEPGHVIPAGQLWLIKFGEWRSTGTDDGEVTVSEAFDGVEASVFVDSSQTCRAAR